MIDLNCDSGESWYGERVGDDAAMFPLVTSANLACGFHGGDPATMLATLRLAEETGTTVGAHPSYRDRAGFGRRSTEVDADTLFAEVLYQVAALTGMATAAGAGVRYLKPHGALYNRIGVDPDQAGAVVSVAQETGLPLLGLPGTVVERLAGAAGVPFLREGFPDRAYLPDGSLAPRSQPGAVLHDPGLIAARAVRMAVEGRVVAVDGSTVDVALDSLCLHGDEASAVEAARAVRAALEAAGVEVRSFVG